MESGLTQPQVSVIVRGLRFLLRRLETPALEGVITQAVIERTTLLPAEDALRFLFRLNAALYPTLGKTAVKYGGGLHTKHRHTRYHDFFIGRIRAGERVLDIGCGIGAVAFDIAEKAGARVLGIDLSPENIAAARRQHPHPNVEYRLQDGMQSFADSSFDVVVLSNILEHLTGRPEFLRRVAKTVHPSRILIRVPLFERDWQVPLKRELGVEWRLDETHETEYTLESFTEEMSEAGCRIRHQEVRWGEIWAEVVPNEP
jgi:SAM-dependent methyltransferase